MLKTIKNGLKRTNYQNEVFQNTSLSKKMFDVKRPKYP